MLGHEITQKLIQLCLDESISYLAVFGSVARGTSNPNSDIDILVSFPATRSIGLLEFIAIKQQLEALLGRSVDLVTKNALKPEVKKAISSDLLEVYNDAA